MTPHRESLRDFDRARRKAIIQTIIQLIRPKEIDLLPFEEVRERLRLRNPQYSGLNEVPLDQIIGSVGRYRDFTRTFLPRSDELRERWAAIDDRVKEGGLPPIELFKVGEAYFVRDGNHRVSVARVQEAPTIQAYVWEYPSLVPISFEDDLDDMLIKHGYTEFLQKSRLNELRPDQRIELTVPGRYRELFEHIIVHRYYMRESAGDEVPLEDAVCSWYDNIYLPIIKAIRNQSVLKQFPGRTEADLYIWISHWEHELSERYGKKVSAEEIVDGFASRKGKDYEQ